MEGEEVGLGVTKSRKEGTAEGDMEYVGLGDVGKADG